MRQYFTDCNFTSNEDIELGKTMAKEHKKDGDVAFLCIKMRLITEVPPGGVLSDIQRRKIVNLARALAAQCPEESRADFCEKMAANFNKNFSF